MKILWFTWKDRTHPLAGGAELLNEELAQRLVRAGYELTLVVGGYKGSIREEKINGYKLVRLGNRFTLYFQAWRYYRTHLRGWADLVIDEINTIPFLAKFYVRELNVLFVHQLCRDIWFYQMPFPLSLLGYLLEPQYLRLLSDRHVLTISPSSREDLLRYGYQRDRVHILSEGLSIAPIDNLSQVHKYDQPTILALGALRAMKRTIDIIRAFELAKPRLPALRLIVAGESDSAYGRKVNKYIKQSNHRMDIEVLGHVDDAHKAELMQRCHIICVTSVKEGWGLIVSEAASQGTPAVVYDVDGLRDSVYGGESGVLTPANTPAAMANVIVNLLNDRDRYRRYQQIGWERSQRITFDAGTKQMIEIMRQIK